MYLGEWEGGLYRIRLLENGPVAQQMVAEERWDVIPGAEPDDVFRARVRAGIDHVAANHPDQTIAVFTHGGVIGRAMAEASGSRPFAFLGADNASINALRRRRRSLGGPRLQRHGPPGTGYGTRPLR